MNNDTYQQSRETSHQLIAEKMHAKVEESLRRIRLYYRSTNQEKNRIYDVPFELILSKNGEYGSVVIDKASIPHRYSQENFRKAERYLQKSIGLLEIQNQSDKIILSCKLPLAI